MTLERLVLTLWITLIEGKARVQNDPDMHHPSPRAEYTEMEAREAYKRVVLYHQSLGEWK